MDQQLACLTELALSYDEHAIEIVDITALERDGFTNTHPGAGASLDEIAQVLRHRSHDTTAIYAKVDRNALRTVIRPWPGGAS